MPPARSRDRMPRADPATPMSDRAPSFQPLYLQIKALLEQSLEARRVAPGRGDPVRDRARGALRRVAGHRAQGDRRAGRRQPRRAAAGQGHVRRDAHRGARVALPLPAHPPQRRQRRVSRQPAASTCGAARRRPRSRACWSSSPGDPVIVLRRVLEYGGEPVVLDEITLPAALFRGLTKARIDALPRLDVRLFRDAVRRADAEGAGAAARRRRRCGAARGSWASQPGAPLLAVDRVTSTYGDRPVEVRRGLCATRAPSLPERDRLMRRGASASRRRRAWLTRRGAMRAIICCAAHKTAVAHDAPRRLPQRPVRRFSRICPMPRQRLDAVKPRPVYLEPARDPPAVAGDRVDPAPGQRRAAVPRRHPAAAVAACRRASRRPRRTRS